MSELLCFTILAIGLLAICATQLVVDDRAFWRAAASVRRAWRGLFQ